MLCKEAADILKGTCVLIYLDKLLARSPPK